MRLDRYSGEKARFRVLRRVDKPEAMKSYDWKDGIAYEEVPAFDCFVLKRQDVHAPAALAAYADSSQHFDAELSTDVRALGREWLSSPGRKIPD